MNVFCAIVVASLAAVALPEPLVESLALLQGAHRARWRTREYGRDSSRARTKVPPEPKPKACDFQPLCNKEGFILQCKEAEDFSVLACYFKKGGNKDTVTKFKSADPWGQTMIESMKVCSEKWCCKDTRGSEKCLSTLEGFRKSNPWNKKVSADRVATRYCERLWDMYSPQYCVPQARQRTVQPYVSDMQLLQTASQTGGASARSRPPLVEGATTPAAKAHDDAGTPKVVAALESRSKQMVDFENLEDSLSDKNC